MRCTSREGLSRERAQACAALRFLIFFFGLSLQVGDPVVTLDRLAQSLEESASRDLLSAGPVAWPGARARGPREEALLLRCSSPRALRAVWEA